MNDCRVAASESSVPRPPLRTIGDWKLDPSLLLDVELDNLLRAYARAERPELHWVETMERVEAEAIRRANGTPR
jgi:hypothetical protein